jgi:hypothetical protein
LPFEAVRTELGSAGAFCCDLILLEEYSLYIRVVRV